MNFDALANYADIVAVPLAMIGIYYIVRQLKLALLESERDHQRRQNEMTLNAYNTVRGDLRDTIRRVRIQLRLADMFDEFTDENLEQIMRDKVLRDDVAKMLGFLNKFAVGIKHDVFNIDLVNDLAGTLFISTFKQFHPYISKVREDYENFYKDYEELVMELEHIRYSKQNIDLKCIGEDCYQFPTYFTNYLSSVFKC
jgi:hypothetical protein